MIDKLMMNIGAFFIIVGGVLLLGAILVLFAWIFGRAWITTSKKWRRICRAESLIFEYKRNREKFLKWKQEQEVHLGDSTNMIELKICRRQMKMPKCEMCGKEYIKSGNNQRFCRDCAALRKKNSDREYREAARIRRRLQPGENRRHIIEATAKARAAGMSYGQYIAGMRESDG